MVEIICEWCKNKNKAWLIGTIIDNITRRTAAYDVFNFNNSEKYYYEDFTPLSLNPADKVSVLNEKKCKDNPLFTEIMKVKLCNNDMEFIQWFESFIIEDTRKEELTDNIKNITYLLTRIMPEQNIKNDSIIRTIIKNLTISFLFRLLYKSPNERKFYIFLQDDDIKEYKNIMHVPGKSRKNFAITHKYKIIIDCKKIFSFSREQQTMVEYYTMTEKWLYYSSSTPIWKKRIIKYSGIIDEINKTVSFENDDFYNYFNYDLEEQKIELQPQFSANFSNDSEILEYFETNEKIIL